MLNLYRMAKLIINLHWINRRYSMLDRTYLVSLASSHLIWNSRCSFSNPKCGCRGVARAKESCSIDGSLVEEFVTGSDWWLLTDGLCWCHTSFYYAHQNEKDYRLAERSQRLWCPFPATYSARIGFQRHLFFCYQFFGDRKTSQYALDSCTSFRTPRLLHSDLRSG